jgi:hypothetical protein
MKFQSFRSAVVFASVIVGSVIPSQAFAQTPIDVLTGIGGATTTSYATTSTYKFTGSMILNSIGFYTNGTTPTYLSYTIRGTRFDITDFSVPNLSAEENGFRWLTISPESMVSNDFVTVSTTGPSIDSGPGFPFPPMYTTETAIFNTFTVNASATVSYVGLETGGNNLSDPNYSNSNLRVSNPGINVAPEPGTLALALTGGCALVGMHIRRRRISN